LIESNKWELIIGIIAFLIAIFIAWQFNLINYLWSALKINFGNLLGILIISFICLFLISILLYYSIMFLVRSLNLKDDLYNKRITLTILVIIFLLCFGFIFINEMFGSSLNQYTLFGSSTNDFKNLSYNLTVDCGDSNNDLVYNHLITCRLSQIPNFSQVDTRIIIYYINGSNFEVNSKSYIPQFNFFPDNDISSIHLELRVFSVNDSNYIYFVQRIEPIFESEQEAKERKDNFLTYLLGLLFLSLITIPQAISSIFKR